MLTFIQRYAPSVDTPFKFFSLEHVITLFIVVVVSYFYIKYIPKIKNSKYELLVRILLAGFLLYSSINLMLYSYKYDLPWYTYIPVATCGLAAYFGPIALLTKNRTLFILTYFYGFGAVLSILGPNLDESINNLYYYEFILRHLFIIYAGIYMIRVFDFKIYKRDFITFFLISFLFTIIGFIISSIVNLPDQLNLFYTMKPALKGTPLNTLFDINPHLYRFVWIVFASFLGYLWGLPVYVNKKDIN